MRDIVTNEAQTEVTDVIPRPGPEPAEPPKLSAPLPDTGSAVTGYTIDLWFPTLADALAWGRRTVTITLH